MKMTHSTLIMVVAISALSVQTLSAQEKLDFAPSDLADRATESSRGVGETIGGWLGGFASTVGGAAIKAWYTMTGNQEGLDRFSRHQDEYSRVFTNQVTQVATETAVTSATEFATERLRAGQAAGEYVGAIQGGHQPTTLETAGTALVEIGRTMDLTGAAGRAIKPAAAKITRSLTEAAEQAGRSRLRAPTPDEVAEFNRIQRAMRRELKDPKLVVNGGYNRETGAVIFNPKPINKLLQVEQRQILAHEGQHALNRARFIGNGGTIEEWVNQTPWQKFWDEVVAYTVQLHHARSRGIPTHVKTNLYDIIQHVRHSYGLADHRGLLWIQRIVLWPEAIADLVALVTLNTLRPIAFGANAIGRSIAGEDEQTGRENSVPSLTENPKASGTEITSGHVEAARANPGQMISATNPDFMSRSRNTDRGGSISDFYVAVVHAPQGFNPRDGLRDVTSHSLAGLDVSVFNKSTSTSKIAKPVSSTDVHRERARALVAQQKAEQARKELAKQIAAAAKPQPQAVVSTQPTYSYPTTTNSAPTTTYVTRSHPTYGYSAPRQTYSHNSRGVFRHGSNHLAPVLNADRIANAASSWVRFGLNAGRSGHYGRSYSGGHGRVIGGFGH